MFQTICSTVEQQQCYHHGELHACIPDCDIGRMLTNRYCCNHARNIALYALDPITWTVGLPRKNHKGARNSQYRPAPLRYGIITIIDLPMMCAGSVAMLHYLRWWQQLGLEVNKLLAGRHGGGGSNPDLQASTCCHEAPTWNWPVAMIAVWSWSNAAAATGARTSWLPANR